MIIEDGAGTGRKQKVTIDNRGNVSSRSGKRSYYISRDDGEAFNLNSHDASAAAGTYIAYWKNTSTTRNLFIDLIRIGAVEAALWKVWFVTGTAAGGSALTVTNLNSNSNQVADATARGDDSITGLTLGAQIANIRTVATAPGQIIFDDTLIIGQGDAIAIEYDTGTTGIAEVLIRGYYE